MNRKFAKQLPKIVMYVLMVLCVVGGVMFYVGGNAGSIDVAGDILNIPRYTDMFLYLNYGLLVLTVFITVFVLFAEFGSKLISSPAGALKALIPLVLFAAIFIATWFSGSSEEIKIIGYDGTDNVGFWSQCTDMIIYSVYVLLVATLGAIITGAIYTKVKK